MRHKSSRIPYQMVVEIGSGFSLSRETFRLCMIIGILIILIQITRMCTPIIDCHRTYVIKNNQPVVEYSNGCDYEKMVPKQDIVF